jgi:hypothetical protein
MGAPILDSPAAIQQYIDRLAKEQAEKFSDVDALLAGLAGHSVLDLLVGKGVQWGYVDLSGTIRGRGGAWTLSHPGVGQYTVTFGRTYAAAPAFLAQGDSGGGDLAMDATPSTTAGVVRLYSRATGVLVAAGFSFLVVPGV